MPTEICFAAESVRVKVEEDPSAVAEAFTSANGLPLRLTRQGQGGEVYINPAMVAFWAAADPSPPPEIQESSPPTTRRETVTDIWGNPLRSKRRR